MDTINSLFSSPFAEALGWTLLHSLWQAAAIACVLGTALIMLRSRTAALRYRLANLALLALLAASIATFYLTFEKPSTPAAIEQQASGNREMISNLTIRETPPPVILPPHESPAAIAWHEYFAKHLPLIVTLWLLGMSVFLLRFSGYFAYVHYLKSRAVFPPGSYWLDLLERLRQVAGIRKCVGLLESGLVKTPLLVGWAKPVILFPVGMINRLDPQEVEAILAHELAHILHNDYLLNLFQSIVETLFYFNPSVWWLSAKIRQERETAADDAAIRFTGDPLSFAKTLVLIQELAFSKRPPSAVIAFAGNRKSQLFQRVQHILNIKSPKNFNMEKLVGTLAVVLVLLGLAYSQSKNAFQFKDHLEAKFDQDISGVWQAEIKEGKVCLTLSRRYDNGSWMNSECFDKSEFSALPQQEGEFTMTRPAGQMVFTGKFEGNEGYGKFKFVTDKTFSDWLAQQGVTGVDEDVMLHLFYAKTDKAYVTSLKQSGYGSITGDDLAQLAIHEVSAEKIKAYHQLSQRLGDGKPSIDKMVELSIHEVTPEYAQELEKIGFKNMSLDDVVGYKIHEISPEYVGQLNNMGFKNLNTDDVMSMKIHEVTPEYLQSLKSAGLTNLTAEEVLEMKIHEINPGNIAELRKMGFDNLSNEDILNLQIHEVEPAFLGEMAKLGFTNLTPEDAMNLKIHEVDANYAAGLKKAGFNDLSVEEILNCKIHEVDAAFVAELNAGGFTGLSVEEVINCKIHEVSPANLKGFKQLGFTDISIEEAINLHIHEVTPEFIRKMQGKGFTDMSLEDYINLKIHFGDKIK